MARLVWFSLVILLGFSRVLRSYARSGRLWQTADASPHFIPSTRPAVPETCRFPSTTIYICFDQPSRYWFY